MKGCRRISLGLALGLCLLAGLTAAEKNGTADTAKAAAGAGEGVKLVGGDLLWVQVVGEDDLSGKFSVGADGHLRINWLPRLKVAGRTVEQVEQDLVALLRTQYLRNPKVQVRLEQPASGQGKGGEVIFVFGEAKKIGSFPYRSGYTLLDAISDCQGFTKFAAPNRARIVRRGKNGQEQVIKVDLEELMKEGAKGKNITLSPGDIINIPASRL